MLPEGILGLIKHEQIRWLVSAIVLGDVKVPNDQRPDWAKSAAVEFWN